MPATRSGVAGGFSDDCSAMFCFSVAALTILSELVGVAGVTGGAASSFGSMTCTPVDGLYSCPARRRRTRTIAPITLTRVNIDDASTIHMSAALLSF